jgi:hypothetical protein
MEVERGVFDRGQRLGGVPPVKPQGGELGSLRVGGAQLLGAGVLKQLRLSLLGGMKELM